MHSSTFLVDARGTQQGYKQHSIRGLGHYALHVLEELPHVLEPARLRYLIQKGSAVPESLQRSGVQFIEHDARLLPVTGARLLDDQFRLPRTLRTTSCALGHFFFHQDSPLFAPFPVVLTIPDAITFANAQLYGLRQRAKYTVVHILERYLARSAAQIVTLSEFSKRDIVRFLKVDPANVHVTPLGVEQRFFSPEDPSRRRSVLERYGLGGDFLLYVGGIDPRKNIRALLHAMNLLVRDQGRPVKLALAGRVETQREYPDLLKAIDQLCPRDAVLLLGYVPDEDLPSLYAAARVFVFPSLYEGFGLPVLQAMAAGAPVVTTSCSSIPEVAGDAVLYADPGDPRDLAFQIGRILDDIALAGELSRQGQMRAAQFTWRETAAQTARVYETVATKSQTA